MIKKTFLLTIACVLAAEAPLGRTTDWWTFGGDGLRDGWEKSEQRFLKEDVKDFRLLWQPQVEKLAKPSLYSVLPPVVLGRLIGSRGFKELAFVAGSNNSIAALDTDLDRIYWQKHFETGKPKRGCAEQLTAAPALPAPRVFGSGITVKHRDVQPLFVLTGDGLLRLLNQDDGSDLETPRRFVPEGVVAGPLNVSGDIVYTTTRAGCGHEAAVWSIDTADPQAEPKSVALGADIVGMGGVMINAQNQLFVTTAQGPLDPEHGKYGGSLVSLNRDMTVNQYFILPSPPIRNRRGLNGTAPTQFTYESKDVTVTAAQDGRLYLLKAGDLGSGDHHHYLSASAVLSAMNGDQIHGIAGGLATWQEPAGTRYVLVPVWGPLSQAMKDAFPDAQVPNGSVIAFMVVDGNDDAPTLMPAWISEDLENPAPPVIAKGVVFVLANGKFPHKGAHATLYALDGTTGKRLYSTSDKIQAAGDQSGLTIANGRVYFATVDGTLQVVGKYLER